MDLCALRNGANQNAGFWAIAFLDVVELDKPRDVLAAFVEHALEQEVIWIHSASELKTLQRSRWKKTRHDSVNR